MNNDLQHELLRARYRKLSDELPEQHKRKWLKAKEKLLTQNLQPKDLIDVLEEFHEEIIHNELDKWASWRRGEMQSWGLKPPEGTYLHQHYKNQINGFKEELTLTQKLNCIKNQTMVDMDTVFSYEDWKE